MKTENKRKTPKGYTSHSLNPRPLLYPCQPSSCSKREEMIKKFEGEAATGHPVGNLVAACPTKQIITGCSQL